MSSDSGHHPADNDPDGRENRRRGENVADIAEPCGQAALDEDDTQRGRAKVLRELGVVKTYPQHAFPEHNSYGEEQQQAGKADPARYPRGNDAGEQRHVQLLQGHVNLVRRHGFWSLELCQLISTDFSERDSSEWSKVRPCASRLPEQARSGGRSRTNW